MDLGRLLELYRGWREALPSVSPFYAVKCNDDPALLKTLAALGTGFDCASKVVHSCTSNRMYSQYKKSERVSVEGTHSGVLHLTSFFIIGTCKQTNNECCFSTFSFVLNTFGFSRFCNFTKTPKPFTKRYLVTVISEKKVVLCFSIVMVSSWMFLDILV